MPLNIPFYEDPAFWAVLVSAIAVALSQLPPIKNWFRNPKLDFDAYSKISITQKIGNPNLQMHFLMTNVGGRKVRIRDINISLSRDGNELTSLPAISYLQNPNDQNPLIFTAFSLSPNEEWSHIINFYNLFNRDEENEFHSLENEMLSDYRKQNREIKKVVKDEDELDELLNQVEHPKELIKRAINFFNLKFIWEAGEYNMNVNVVTDHDGANISRAYSFTIFESQSEQQKESTEEYKYGADIWWDNKKIKNTILPIKEV